jgi:NAD(P)-dependent dehydrogenase (short-subunit alcohol dehydrogenase family)
MNDTTWMITGASSGFGHALAEHVLSRGDNVALAATSTAAMSELASRHPHRAVAIRVDVTDRAQREAALQQVERTFGAVDILVNNAAVDYVGALEEQEEADVRWSFEVNFFGAVALTRLVLPGMRQRHRGTIVNVSSMDGIASLPGNGYYSSTKFAIEGFTEALWGEIEPLGLRAMLVELGSFRTGIQHRTKASGAAINDYAATGGLFREMIGAVTPEQFPGDPARAAAVLYDVVSSGQRRHRLILGSDAHRRIGVKVDELRADLEDGKQLACSTDFPGAGRAVL